MSKHPYLALAALALLAGVAWAAPPTATPPGDVARAKTHYLAGESYYAQKMYADAARQFEEAYRLSRRVALQFNIGRAYDAGGDVVRALKAYRIYLSLAGNASDASEVRGRVAELEKLMAHVQLKVSVDGATVRVDGETIGTTPLPPAPLELNPGRHTVEVTHPDHTPFHREVDAPPGATLVVEARLAVPYVAPPSPAPLAVDPEPKKQPLYKKWWLWTAVGGGVLVVTAVGLGVGLGTQSQSAPTIPLPRIE